MTMHFFWELWKYLESRAGKSMECAKRNRLIYESLEAASIERRADDGGLAWEASEGSKEFQGILFDTL